MAYLEPGLVYDSADRVTPFVGTIRRLIAYRGLIGLLIVRDLTVRYKRSLFGTWWTLLNPLFSAAIFWVVFNSFFRPRIPGAPYIVYMLSGLLVVNFFSQGLTVTGNSVAGSAQILTKVYVPPEAFAVSAAGAQAVNFVMAVVPLFVIQLATGTGIAWTAIALPFPALALLVFVTGAGLILATLAIRFHDVMDLVAVLLNMLVFATPTFYPIDIVPDRYLWLVKLNPLYWYVDVVRNLAYGGSFGSYRAWLVIAATSLGAFAVGVLLFGRRWKSLAVML